MAHVQVAHTTVDLVDFNRREVGGPQQRRGITIDFASVEHPTVGDFHGRLHLTGLGALRCRYMLHKEERGAGLEYSIRLGDHLSRVVHAAQNEGGHHGVSARVVDIDPFAPYRANVDIHAEATGIGGQLVAHHRIRLHGDYANTARVVPKIGTGAWAQLNNGPRKAADGVLQASPESATASHRCKVQKGCFDVAADSRAIEISRFPRSHRLVVLGRVVVANDLIDDEAQELLRERRVETGIVSKGPQPCDLHLLTVWIGSFIACPRLVLADPLGDLETFGQQVNERGVDVVDARSALTQYLVVVHGRQ